MECSPYLARPLRQEPDVALERLRTAIEAARYAVTGCEVAGIDASDLRDIRDGLDDCLSNLGWLENQRAMLDTPCSDEARAAGCSCRMPLAREYDPEPIIDKFCPLHGTADPDAMRDARMDAAE